MMNKIKKLIYLVCLFMFLQACDCLQPLIGTVIDKDTKKPILEVKIYKIGKEDRPFFTDSKGEFSGAYVSGGLFRCPPFIVIIEKEGYETIQKKSKGIYKEIIELKKKGN